MARCECGRLHFSNKVLVYECTCGRTVRVEPARDAPKRFGDAVRATQPYLFSGSRDCRCKDAIAKMNHWGKEKSLEQLSTLAYMLRKPEDEIAAAIKQTTDYLAQ